MGDTYMREYMRAYHLPKRVENLRRKMRALEMEAEAVSAKDLLRCLKAANEAFEREVKIAYLQGRIRKHLRKREAGE